MGHGRPILISKLSAKADMSRYKVMVDDNFHYMNEDERYEHGIYPTAEEAIAECKRIVDADIQDFHEQGHKGADLYEFYVCFGEDPFIVAVDEADKTVDFSAWDYAKDRSLAMME